VAALVLCFATEAHAEDEWWARDKALHFGVSGALAAGGYGAGSLVFEERWKRAGVGATVALTAGIAKEAYDEVDYGGASYKDFVFDVAGTCVGVAAAWLIDWAINGRESPHQASVQMQPIVRF
jgi:putative lipoprotein